MKIAQIDPSLFTWPYDQELTKALSGLGHEALIFGKVLPREDPRGRSGLLRQHFYSTLASLPALPRPAERAVKGISHAGALWGLWRTLARWKPSVIHFQWLPLPVVDRRFLPLFRRLAPLVHTVHDTQPFNGEGSFLQTVGTVDALRQFDRLILHTGQGISRVSQHVPAEKLAQVSHGLLHDGRENEALPVVREAGPELRFLIFGMIKPYKGIDVAIRALSHLSAHARKRCRLRIVGQPHMDPGELTELARASGTADRIEFHFGFVSDEEMAREFAAADVLLFPYREIESSGVLMAALGKEKPIVASRLGFFAEIIGDGEHGFLVPPGDAEALALAMERLIETPTLCRDFAAAVARLRQSVPGWDQIARRTVAVYEDARDGWRRRQAAGQRASMVPG